jgi:hypothetical protein
LLILSHILFEFLLSGIDTDGFLHKGYSQPLSFSLLIIGLAIWLVSMQSDIQRTVMVFVMLLQASRWRIRKLIYRLR